MGTKCSSSLWTFLWAGLKNIKNIVKLNLNLLILKDVTFMNFHIKSS